MTQSVILKKNCITCNKEFSKNLNVSMKTWTEGTKYCSISCSKSGNTYRRGQKHNNIWNKGIKTGLIPWNKGNGEYAKQLGFGKWMTGKKLSTETRQKQRQSNLDRIEKGTHNFYIDGRTPQNQIIRTTLEYRLWREAVFKRDDYTCQWCLARCGKGKAVKLNADHIQLFSEHPELRFAIDNGRTLCQECHYKRHRKE